MKAILYLPYILRRCRKCFGRNGDFCSVSQFFVPSRKHREIVAWPIYGKGGQGLTDLNCETREGESDYVFALYTGVVSEVFDIA